MDKLSGKYLQILNIFLRGITLASKLFLIVFLAKLLSPGQIGTYGLIVATINYSLYIVGFDFYTFSTREIVSCESAQWPRMIRDQAVFTFVMYVITFPLLLVLFTKRVLDWEVFGWFYSLLICEHLSQELNRILIAIERPLMASVVMFVRMGSWCYVVIVLMSLSVTTRTLTTVWSGWLIGTMSSVLLAVYCIKDLKWVEIRKSPINWDWIAKGVRTAFIFFLGTIALRGVFTVDRYLLKYYAGLEILGAYVFFILIGNGFQSLIDAGVIVFVYPKLVGAYRNKKFEEYSKYLTELIYGILVSIVVICAGLWIFIHPILEYVGRPIYLENIRGFWLIIAAVSIWCVSMIPHYILYSKGRDKTIVTTTWISFAVFALLSLKLVPDYGLYGIAYSLIASFTVNLLLKILFMGGKLADWQNKTEFE